MRTICSTNSGIPDNLKEASTNDNMSTKNHNDIGPSDSKTINHNKKQQTNNKAPRKASAMEASTSKEFVQLNREVLPDSCRSPPVDHISLPATETTLKLLKSYFERYREFIKFNPIWISDVESALYWVSYLLSTTRFYNSRLISELLYSCSSLLTLLNDTLLRKAYSVNPKNNPHVDTLQTVLTFIEYLQVFLELAALRLYGSFGKWLIVSLIEIVKATVRLILLFYFEQGLTKKTYALPLNRLREFERFKIREQCVNVDTPDHTDKNNGDDADDKLVSRGNDDAHSDADREEIDKCSFWLESSGRIIRKLENSPDKSKRFWLTPIQSQRLKRLLRKQNKYHPSITPLNRQRIFGEILHILRPLVHLSAGAVSNGINKWSPYLLSFGIDIMSLKLLQGDDFLLSRPNLISLVVNSRKPSTIMEASTSSSSPLNSKFPFIRIPKFGTTDTDPVEQVWNWSEQMEIQRRYLALFMYLLRSPFYDRFTKERLLRTLSFFSNYIPIFGRLIRPLINYLPEWQRIYFYNWTL